MSTIDLNTKEYVIEVSPFGWTVRFVSDDIGNSNIYDFVSLADAKELTKRLETVGYNDYHNRVH